MKSLDRIMVTALFLSGLTIGMLHTQTMIFCFVALGGWAMNMVWRG